MFYFNVLYDPDISCSGPKGFLLLLGAADVLLAAAVSVVAPVALEETEIGITIGMIAGAVAAAAAATVTAMRRRVTGRRTDAAARARTGRAATKGEGAIAVTGATASTMTEPDLLHPPMEMLMSQRRTAMLHTLLSPKTFSAILADYL